MVNESEAVLVIRKTVQVILLVIGIMSGSAGMASDSDVTPLEIGLFPPLQLPRSDYGVRGLRLTGVGLNREVIGIDLALLGNITDTTFKGTAISGLFNYNRGSSTVIGLQLAIFANLNTGHSEVYGVQIGGYNLAGTVHGLQLGLLNVANELHGVQIGLFNINKNGLFHASPIINAAF